MVGAKILVIDESSSCELLKIYFQAEGYEVITATDGDEGLNMFRRYDPDIVLLETVLQKKDGVEICREIRFVAGGMFAPAKKK